jgi:glucose dehydrogenase
MLPCNRPVFVRPSRPNNPANMAFPVGSAAHPQAAKVRDTGTEWLNYASDKASSKYSPLAQIGKDSFNRLSVAWTWRSAEEEITKANHLKTWAWEATPIMVGGILVSQYVALSGAAIDAATGKTRWVYDPETWKNGTPSNNEFVHRGVAYWADGNDRRILFGTGDGYLLCLNAETGKPILTFGQEGRIDLTQGLGSSCRSTSLWGLLPTSHLSRRRGNGIEGPRCSPGSGDATRRRARFRRSHRQAAVDF